VPCPSVYIPVQDKLWRSLQKCGKPKILFKSWEFKNFSVEQDKIALELAGGWMKGKWALSPFTRVKMTLSAWLHVDCRPNARFQAWYTVTPMITLRLGHGCDRVKISHHLWFQRSSICVLKEFLKDHPDFVPGRRTFKICHESSYKPSPNCHNLSSKLLNRLPNLPLFWLFLLYSQFSTQQLEWSSKNTILLRI